MTELVDTGKIFKSLLAAIIEAYRSNCQCDTCAIIRMLAVEIIGGEFQTRKAEKKAEV